jgi:hypothetical protein
VIEPLNHGRWRRTGRRYCNDDCKYDHYAVKRAKALVDQVGVVKFFDLLDKA